MKKFRPRRAADFSEMVWWVFITNKEQADEMNKNDQPKEAANDKR